MDPNRQDDTAATRPVRNRGAVDAPKPLRAGSGVRVWPPKPSAVTLADFSLDSDSVKDSFLPIGSPVIEAILVEHLCPICEVKLIDPVGVGICPKCGLCRSLKDGCEKLAEVEEQEREEERNLPPRPVPSRIPSWVWGLLGGCMLIVGTAIVAGLSFPHHCRERTVWSTYQLLFGLATIVVGQWWVILKLEPDLGKLGLMEMFVISGRLWSCAFSRMPQTLGPVYLGCWGMLIAFTAVTITGGLADWFVAR